MLLEDRANIVSRNRAVFSSIHQEWRTPQTLFDRLNSEFRFTIDVCASPENAKCKRYFTKEDDALSRDWGSRCWMNPPYGPDLKHWMKKAFGESRRGALVVCLVPARTDTKWFHEYALRASEIRFIQGRIRFGEGKGRATFPSIVVVFRPK